MLLLSVTLIGNVKRLEKQVDRGIGILTHEHSSEIGDLCVGDRLVTRFKYLLFDRLSSGRTLSILLHKGPGFYRRPFHTWTRFDV